MSTTYPTSDATNRSPHTANNESNRIEIGTSHFPEKKGLPELKHYHSAGPHSSPVKLLREKQRSTFGDFNSDGGQIRYKPAQLPVGQRYVPSTYDPFAEDANDAADRCTDRRMINAKIKKAGSSGHSKNKNRIRNGNGNGNGN